MKLIIGLGNPEKKYEKNRHNAGFLRVAFLQQEWGFEAFTLDKKLSASISSGTLDSEKVLLVKPDTFMNASGAAVQKLLHFYKLSPRDILIIHDDLDIAPGTFRTTLSSRSAGHNGVENIIESLGTQDFFRIRLGIGRPDRIPPETGNVAGRPSAEPEICFSAHDFVLQNFSPEELASLTTLFPTVKDEILRWLST